MSVLAVHMLDSERPSPPPPFGAPLGLGLRQDSFTFELPLRFCLDAPSDSSRATSPSKRRSVRWGRTVFSREASRGDDVLDEKAFPLSHTRTLQRNGEDMDCDQESDCEIGYHSDTAIDIRYSPVLAFKRQLVARIPAIPAYYDEQTSSDFDEEDDEDSAGDVLFSNASSEQADSPAMSPAMGAAQPISSSDNDDEEIHTPLRESQSPVPVLPREDVDEEDDAIISEYEAPVLRKRKRKPEYASKGRGRKHGQSDDETMSSESLEHIEAPLPIVSKKVISRRNPGKRIRVEQAFVVPGTLEFPCPYVSPEGRPCAKNFPRWTDYEKHYETMHTGDSGYPWVQKIEAKDCPFRCPHPIPTASKPKPKQGRLVKTVEYGCCDFVTRKNTHDFERHWKGNHIRSEALFIARGNMQMDEAKYVNVKEKFDIAYALCPKCPRCFENFTRTDALTRHLRSPCAGGAVGAAMDDTHHSMSDGSKSAAQ